MARNLKELYDQLGISDKKEFSYLVDIDYNVSNTFSLRYKNALFEMKPEAIFCLKNEPFILFFNLEKSTNVEHELKRIHKQSWNFDKAPIIVVSTSTEIVFYNAFDFDTQEHKLALLTNSEKDFQNFAYENLYTGKLFNIYKNKFIDKTRVNTLLFQHIKDYRKELIKEGLKSSLANNLLARIIFLKYLQDREIIVNRKNHNIIAEAFESKDKLYNLFKYLKKEFNGDLFDIADDEEDKISSANIITMQAFAKSTSIYGQMRLIPFDFSIIPIELISNIYESFLNSRQSEIKAYYTPTFLVDYMINTTINPFLNSKNKKDSNCKVLDPACGSGIFLIEALRKIICKEEKINKDKKINAVRLRKLVENNIFGVDKDEDAINIAIFSLYITLLDYQDPKSILDFKFPHLKNTNFFVSDFFKLDNNFNSILKNIDIILSNPPYGSIKDRHLNWANQNNVPVSDNQIAQSFLARVKDFCSSKTIVSMVVTSKLLYNNNAIDFRKYFLEHFKILQILELSSVRRLIFSGAIPPVCVIKYEYSDNTISNLKNKIKYFSIKPNLFFKYFKTLLIEKNDEKNVEQKLLCENDFLWKILLYGNILDFYFIKKIKENYDSIDTLDCEDKIISKQGLILNGKSSYNSKHLIGLPFLDTNKKALKQFYIDFNDCETFDRETVHRVRTPDVYKAPQVLLKRGVDSTLACVASFCNKDLVFTNSINAIKFKKNNDSKLLNLTGLFNSNLYTYLNLLTSSAIAVERNEIYEKEFLKYPYKYDEKTVNLVKLLNKSNTLQNKNKLNENIYKAFNLTEVETDLIDYAINISIPVWKFGDNIAKSKTIPAFKTVKGEQLKAYINIFIENFAEQYKYFNTDVYSFEYCTLINFKARENNISNPQINFIKDSKLEDTLKIVSNLSVSEITNEIYIKKDIKGFNENSFFVLKTNEYKNWHKAIARLDVNEFENAIWEAELDLSE